MYEIVIHRLRKQNLLYVSKVQYSNPDDRFNIKSVKEKSSGNDRYSV